MRLAVNVRGNPLSKSKREGAAAFASNLGTQKGTPGALALSCPGTLSLHSKRSGTRFALRLRLALTKGRRLKGALPGQGQGAGLLPFGFYRSVADAPHNGKGRIRPLPFPLSAASGAPGLTESLPSRAGCLCGSVRQRKASAEPSLFRPPRLRRLFWERGAYQPGALCWS